MNPIAYASMREHLKQAGEMTPDHPDFWPEVIFSLRRVGINQSTIARKIGAQPSRVTEWASKTDVPSAKYQGPLLKLLAEAARPQWIGLGGK